MSAPARPAPRGRVRRAAHFVFARRLCFGGLAGALTFFCLSIAPSLLPRGPVTQGVLSGAAAAIGYGLGSAASATTRRFLRHEPSHTVKRIAWWLLLAVTVVLVPLFLRFGLVWQDEVRRLIGVEPEDAWNTLLIAVTALGVGLLLLGLARGVRGFARGTARAVSTVVPRRISVPVGVAAAAFLVVGVVQGFLLTPLLDALNSAYSVKNTTTSEGVSQPTSPYRSGSPASLVPWDTLGEQGRDFTGVGAVVGPTAADIAHFNGQPATEPIRVYVGLQSAPTLQDRVNLALRELDRTHAWSRKVLVVVTTTGTGWVDERAASALEYMFNGDTAEVGMQYSYLPSWVSFLVDQQKAADTGTALIQAVEGRLSSMPPSTRPRLYLFGESLGSYGAEAAFPDPQSMEAHVDGALLEGPVFSNHIHNTVTADRAAGSPYWRPVYHDGLHFRFAVSPADLSKPDAPWTSPRIVYLQNSSDPITYFSFDLLWQPPAWLDQPRGPDVSPDMIWIPFVSFWQVAADMMFSGKAPLGHGHTYGVNAVNAWAAIAQPPGWTPQKTERLREVLATPKA
jgi:uncharacterized membrane protein